MRCSRYMLSISRFPSCFACPARNIDEIDISVITIFEIHILLAACSIDTWCTRAKDRATVDSITLAECCRVHMNKEGWWSGYHLDFMFQLFAKKPKQGRGMDTSVHSASRAIVRRSSIPLVFRQKPRAMPITPIATNHALVVDRNESCR